MKALTPATAKAHAKKVADIKVRLLALKVERKEDEIKTNRICEAIKEVTAEIEENGDEDGILSNTREQLKWAYIKFANNMRRDHEIEDLEKQYEEERGELHVYYNGFKIKRDGKFSKLMKGSWNHGENIHGEDRITFYADSYGWYGPLVGLFFDTCANNSDSMTDYYERTRYELHTTSENWNTALKIVAREEEKTAARIAKRKARNEAKRKAWVASRAA